MKTTQPGKADLDLESKTNAGSCSTSERQDQGNARPPLSELSEDVALLVNSTPKSMPRGAAAIKEVVNRPAAVSKMSQGGGHSSESSCNSADDLSTNSGWHSPASREDDPMGRPGISKTNSEGYGSGADSAEGLEGGLRWASDESSTSSKKPPPLSVNNKAATKKRKDSFKHDNSQRKVRNAREQERSQKVSDQFVNLQDVLTEAGVSLRRGTKSNVLAVALDYIHSLQNHHRKVEQDNQMLLQQIHLIRKGSSGETAAKVICNLVAQNGVSSGENSVVGKPSGAINNGDRYMNGNFSQGYDGIDAATNYTKLTELKDQHYSCAFHTAPTALALATLGGSFVDCNVHFCNRSGYSKNEILASSVFSLVAKEDLQIAFDGLTMLLERGSSSLSTAKPLVVRGTMRNSHKSLGLRVAPIWGDAGKSLKFLCISLADNPSSTLPIFDISGSTTTEQIHNTKDPAIWEDGAFYATG